MPSLPHVAGPCTLGPPTCVARAVLVLPRSAEPCRVSPGRHATFASRLAVSCRVCSANTPGTCCRPLPSLARLGTALPPLPASQQLGADDSPWIGFVPLPGGTFRLSPTGHCSHSRRFFA